jgi:hypothetical protein
VDAPPIGEPHWLPKRPSPQAWVAGQRPRRQRLLPPQLQVR